MPLIRMIMLISILRVANKPGCLCEIYEIVNQKSKI